MAEQRPGRGGVIFDVDGTLLDTNYLHVAAWWEAFRERGHDVACADIHRAIGLSSDDLIGQVLGRPDPSVSGAHSRYVAAGSAPVPDPTKAVRVKGGAG